MYEAQTKTRENFKKSEIQVHQATVFTQTLVLFRTNDTKKKKENKNLGTRNTAT